MLTDPTPDDRLLVAVVAGLLVVACVLVHYEAMSLSLRQSPPSLNLR